MSENKYTAADFAAAEFAKRPNGGMAARLDPEDTLPWRVVNGKGLWSWFNDYDMAEEGWVPVPASPAKPTITESKFEEEFGLFSRTDKRLMMGRLDRLGITVVPDPEPTNAEKLEEIITDEWPHSEFEIRALAERLDARYVKAPGGDGE
ncbi:hypothetical protein ABZX73_06370 [Brevibacterium casei]